VPAGLWPLAILGFGAFLLSGALGQRLATRGLAAAAPAFLVRWLAAGFLAWGAAEAAWRLGLDAVLPAGSPATPWLQAGLDFLAVALTGGLAARSMNLARRKSDDGAGPGDAATPRRVHGSAANDPFGSIPEVPWRPSTALMTFGGLVAGLAAGFAAAVAALWGASAADPLVVLARAADLLNLGAAGALAAWAWQSLSAGSQRGLGGGLAGGLALRGAFVWMMQAEYPWPFLGVGLAAMGWLVAWRFIGDVRVEYHGKQRRPKRRKTGPGCDDDC
jgi:hypothetical protein